MAEKVEGLDKMLKRLSNELSNIEDRSVRGLLKAGYAVEIESKKNTPVEYGNLKQSGYTRKAPDDARAVEVGYTASYAPFVHENMDQKLRGERRPSGLGTYWNPGGPKFLENATRTVDIIGIVQKDAKIK